MTLARDHGAAVGFGGGKLFRISVKKKFQVPDWLTGQSTGFGRGGVSG
ncbi:hypothetical protein SBA4_3860002 [Candidatus Sulfopaludibacter sp. SbA4]|nr:hypothetical protein SBA4_3860002 [Candidatus Sulfopaludibacter sp. SbA4]